MVVALRTEPEVLGHVPFLEIETYNLEPMTTDLKTRRRAVLEQARAAHRQGATHDCGEWLDDDICQLCGRHIPPEVLSTFYVIYFNAADYRGQYVVRRQFVVRGSQEPIIERRTWFEGLVGGTLGAARASLPKGLTRLGRQPGDDPSIFEVWMA